MTRRGLRPLFLFAAMVSGSCCLAQTTGGAGASAGYIESGGPDVLHQRDSSYSGPSLFGALSSFTNAADLRFEWLGVGTPDFHINGLSYWPNLVLEASVDQRAYLVAENARFAWDPDSGVLDSRVPALLQGYRPYSGSAVGYFDPATIPAARSLLSESSPGWAMRDYRLELRSRDKDQGFAMTIAGTDREGMLPRTFVTATGFRARPIDSDEEPAHRGAFWQRGSARALP